MGHVVLTCGAYAALERFGYVANATIRVCVRRASDDDAKPFMYSGNFFLNTASKCRNVLGRKRICFLLPRSLLC